MGTGRGHALSHTLYEAARRMRASAVAGALLVGAALTVGVVETGAASDAATVSWAAWRSSPTDERIRLSETTPTTVNPSIRLNIATDQLAQTWRGVGASLTDASVGILQPSTDATTLLFDPRRPDGAHLNLVRLPLTATDFSSTGWTFGWNDTTRQLAPPAEATAGAGFVTDSLLPLRPDLQVIAVPWTAPSVMKTSASLNGGSLTATSQSAYGRMLVAQADWLQQRGVPLSAMSLGNEPYHSAWDYPTMLMTDAQMVGLAQQVSPELAQRSIELWSVDHNWEHRGHYDAVNDGAPGAFSASAFHCYAGQVWQMFGVAPAPIMTECTGTDDGYAGTFRWDMKNLVVGAIDAGSTGLMMWNLALNENHGPRLGGCATCRGVIDVHSQTGQITRGPEFYTLAHLARAAEPGADVLGRGPVSDIPYVAFRNPDGTIGIVGHNDTGATQTIAASLDSVAGDASFTIGGGELFTLRSATTRPSIVNTSAPRVYGTFAVGTKLTASGGTWDQADATLGFQWALDRTLVADATASSFVLPAAAVGKTVTVTVTASKAGFEPSTATSAPTVPVAKGTFDVTRPPRITGTARVGYVVAHSAATLSPVPTKVTFRWLRNGSAIRDATAPKYRLTRADRGRRISLKVVYARVGFSTAVKRTVSTAIVRRPSPTTGRHGIGEGRQRARDVASGQKPPESDAWGMRAASTHWLTSRLPAIASRRSRAE